MTPRIRVYELARQLDLESRDVIERLRSLGITASSHSATVTVEEARRLRRACFAERAPRRPTSTLARVVDELRPHQARLWILLTVDLLATPLLLLSALPMKIAVDTALGGRPLPSLVDAFVPDGMTTSTGRLLVVVAVLQVAVVLLAECQRLASYVGHTSLGERITLAFRTRMFRHSQDLSLAYHDTRSGTEARYRIEYDAPGIQYLVDGALPFVSATVALVTTLSVIALIDWHLALIAMAVAPALFVLTRRKISGFRDAYKGQRQLESRAFSVISEVFGALRVVKAFGSQAFEERRFATRATDALRARVRLSLAEGLYGVAINTTTAFGTAIVLLIGIRKVTTGSITLGDLLVVITYLAALYQPLKEAAQKVGDLQASMAGAERAFELLDEDCDVPQRPNPHRIGRARGEILFDRVGFSYGDHMVLRGVSFSAPPGARVGIRGRTGSGKTTLVSLLLRFYDPTGGRILLDGVDLRDVDVDELRDQFALVLQEPVLFSTTIRENIAYGRPGARPDEIEAAARSANAHEFIASLPKGYDTLVGERGMLLSGGERQRVAIARAFLKDAPVLVLDEPTSSVDVATEAGILDAMERLMEGRTTLMIAHRLSTLDGCDITIEVTKGRVTVQERRLVPA